MTLAAALIAIRIASPSAARAEPQKIALALRTVQAPSVDGRLDEPTWQRAAPIAGFVQKYPAERTPPSEETELRILYDDDAVYVAIHAFDRDVPVSRLSRRDKTAGDWVEISIDSTRDRTTGFLFRVTAAGVQCDSRLYDDNAEEGSWDAVWRSAVQRTHDGWTAELAIPLGVLRFASALEHDWGLQVRRYLSRRNETTEWTYIPSTVDARVSRFGALSGLRDLRPQRVAEFRPFVVARREANRPGADADNTVADSVDWGVDFKVGLTSDLILDVAINPDFGQVEADPEILNLTRFEIDLPENRPFFLERSDLFASPIAMFYSRRVGESLGLDVGADLGTPDGTAAVLADPVSDPPILGAARVTGRVGGHVSVGVLGAVIGSEDVIADAGGRRFHLPVAPIRSYSAARLRYDVGPASYLGATATAFNRLSDERFVAAADRDQLAQSVDGQWQSADGLWRAIAQAVVSERRGGSALQTPDGLVCDDPAAQGCVPITRANGTALRPGDVGYGAIGNLTYVGHHVLADVSSKFFSRTLDVDAVGFLNDFDQFKNSAAAAYRDTQPGGRVVQSYAVGLAAEQASNLDLVPLELRVGGEYEATFTNFMNSDGAVWLRLPGTWDPYETLDGTPFERPLDVSAAMAWKTDPQKRVALGLSGTAYRDLGEAGRGGTVEVTSNLRLMPELEVSLTPAGGLDVSALRFVDCSTASGAPCDGGMRTYLFGRLDSGFLSLTGRVAFSFSPALTLEGTAQLFLARGDFRNYQTADVDGDGKLRRSDFSPAGLSGEDLAELDAAADFEDASLNTTTVLRWEFVPGAAAFAVFTRRQSGAGLQPGAAPGFRPAAIGDGPQQNLFLLKVAMFFR